MTETGAPPPSPSNSAERAKLIAERVRGDMNRETEDIGRDKQDRRQDRPIRAESERLPPKTENQPTPQRLEGHVEKVDGNSATIRTDSGDVKIRIPEDVQIRAGQRVSVEIPPQSRSGDTVTVRVEAPPAETPPPPRPDFPPLKTGDTVIATAAPVAVATTETGQRQSPPPATTVTKPEQAARFSSAQLAKLDLPAANKIPALPVSSGFNAGQIEQAFTTSFALDPKAPPQNWLNTDIRTLSTLNTASINTAPENTPTAASPPQSSIMTEDDNALTQMAQTYSQKAETQALSQMTKIPRSLAMTDTAFSTLTQNAVTTGMAETPALLKNLFNTAPTAQPAAAIKTFFQIEVLSILPPDMPPAEIQKQILALVTPQTDKQTDKPAMPSASNPATPNNQMSPQAGTTTTTTTQSTNPPVLANVIGVTKTGQTLITVPNNNADQGHQLLHIQTQVMVPAGTQMLVNLTPMTADTLQTAPDLLNKLPTEMASQITTQTTPQAGALPPPIGLPAIAPTWPALQESLNVLQQTAPQVAQAVQNSLPSPSPRMVSTALFFLAALKMGGIDSWLGDKNLDALKNSGKSGLVDRLAGDFGRISSQASETLSGQWKAITLPMLYDGQVENLQFFVRSEESHQGEENGDQDDSRTRFILNLELSKIGPLQLDGYLATSSLNIILRTDHRMDSSIRQDLMKVFGDALETVNLKGGLSFQNRPDDWVRISPTPTRDGFFI